MFGHARLSPRLPAVLIAGLLAAAPAAAAPSPDEATEQTKVINQELAKAWDANKLKPSARATDYEFVRRATIDIIGRIATPEEVVAYATDMSPNKRSRLVHKLLYDKKYAEEYAKHWGNVWTNWLLTRSGHPTYREQMHLWLEEKFAANAPYKAMVEELVAATGKTNDNHAVNFILAHMGEKLPAGEDGAFEAVPITSRVTRLFLGLQTQCVQCHDHPFNPEWKQQHFWGVNAFFRQVTRDATPTPNPENNRMMAMQVQQVRLFDDPKLNPTGMIFYEQRSGLNKGIKMTFLDGKRPEKDKAESKASRRQLLAEMVTGHENFGKAITNRMWAHFFGRGLNENPTFDDFGEHNKVVHPELLDRIGKDFVGYANTDLKQLIYWICTSDAYGLSSVANATNAKPDAEPFFSRMALKAMSPEVLLESLLVANKIQLKGDEKKDLVQSWMRKLVRNFGDDEGNEVNFNGTVVQALLMMNGKELNAEVGKRDEGTVVLAIKKAGGDNPSRILDSLFLAALNRPATAAETAQITKVKTSVTIIRDDAGKDPKNAPKGKPGKPAKPAVAAAAGPAADVVGFYQDVLWALLNSNEFILNH